MTLRAALMGTGWWATAAHLPALRAAHDVELVACVGVDQAHATEFATVHAIPGAYGSLDDLLASPDLPDALIIAAPDDVHAPATRSALAAGVAVFSEKPLANDAATAYELAWLADASGLPATVGFSFRYSPAIQALRQDLVEGSLGAPWLVELSEYNAQFHPSRGKPVGWKGDPSHARGGALFEYASHVLDLAGWLFGPVRRVSANLTHVLPGAQVDDIATLQLGFDPPAIGMLVAGWVLSGDIPGIRIRVHGAAGMAEVEMTRAIEGGQAYRRYDLDGRVDEAIHLEAVGDIVGGYAARHVADFLAVIGGAPSWRGTLPTLADGARTQAVLDAALEATTSWLDISEPHGG